MSDTEIIFSFNKHPDPGYTACAQGHQILVEAETMEELQKKVNDAIALHFSERNPLPVPRFVEAQHCRWLGSAKGEFTVPDDFNDPLPKEIEDLFW
jgi:hypothetical protein